MRNSGSIAASGPSAGSGGRILIEAAYAKVDRMLRAERGSVRVTGSDSVAIGGSIDVSAVDGGLGGDVTVEGDAVTIGSTASVDASGLSGAVLSVSVVDIKEETAIYLTETLSVEAGARITADSLSDGNGGVVILWADGDTLFEGGS